nr:hypothetical protein [Haliscomenobacter sp.]
MQKIAYTLLITFSFLFILESFAQNASTTPYHDVSFQYPDFVLPTSVKTWETRRKAVRQTIKACFGPLPARPKPAVKTLRTEKHPGYTIEYFEFFNGMDATVPGIILIPEQRTPKLPASFTIITTAAIMPMAKTNCSNPSGSTKTGQPKTWSSKATSCWPSTPTPSVNARAKAPMAPKKKAKTKS